MGITGSLIFIIKKREKEREGKEAGAQSGVLWALPAWHSGKEKSSHWKFTEIFLVLAGCAGNTVCLVQWLIK